mmetsp:Transcript_6044/g.9639  ORF Transcript_6044/g.9639 Transcript_6044/m.9639 type:complete len:169 (+) Transcript_6044:100-606(+)
MALCTPRSYTLYSCPANLKSQSTNRNPYPHLSDPYPSTPNQNCEQILIQGVKGAGQTGGSSIRDPQGRIRLFLATDATPHERTLVSKEFATMSACPEVEGGCSLSKFASKEDLWNPWEFDSVEGAILEQLVCAQASIFVGTRLSTFSETIVQERLRIGFPIESNFLLP